MATRILNIFTVLFLFLFVVILTSCSDLKKGEGKMPVTDKVTAEEWKIISQKRIIFGHRSVGNNILSGVKTLAEQDGVKLKIAESRNAPTEFGINHFNIGTNEDPQSKIKDFADAVRKGAASGADLALMKLCYIDINKNSDAKQLAENYISNIETLSQQFPQTQFVAVTLPLRTVQTGPKAWMKKMLGREAGGYADNYKRQEFNSILRNKFGKQGKIFDLAKFENEEAGSYQYLGKPLEVLNQSMTNDGGHLNAKGEQFVAAKMLKFIATVSNLK